MLYATVRQRKVFVKKPTMVVRNGVNVDTLVLEMDDEWAAMDSILCVFTLRYGTTETTTETVEKDDGSTEEVTKTITVYQEVSKEMLHTFGEPLQVPWECLVESGKLSLSCVGYVGESQIMRTMKADSFWSVVQEGVDTGDTPLEPTPTLYEQILAVVGTANAAAALCQKLKKDLEEAKERGDFDGEDGVTPIIQVGTVQTGQAGGEAQVNQTGTPDKVILNFVIPRGMQGPAGKSPTIEFENTTVGNIGALKIKITNADGTSQTAMLTNGQNGRPGADGGYFVPSVSEEGVLSWEYQAPQSGMSPIPMPDDAVIKGKDGRSPVIELETKEGDTSFYYVLKVTNADGKTQEISLFNGEDGRPGGYYYPTISEDGVLSWEYVANGDAVLEGPEPVQLGGFGGSGEGAVSYAEEQKLTEEERERARENIDAAQKPLVVNITRDSWSVDMHTVAGAINQGRTVIGVLSAYLPEISGGDMTLNTQKVYDATGATGNLEEQRIRFEFETTEYNTKLFSDQWEGSRGGGTALYIKPMSATSTTYGNIKADPAEESDTVPARIGADGKLYVAQSRGTTGDYIPAPETATVGQTIQVTEVDEDGRPVAWEAVDFPGGSKYTLPVATAETLGGVKPAAVTADMTQEVGVDALGKLWTAPGGSGAAWELLYETVMETEVAWMDIKNFDLTRSEYLVAILVPQVETQINSGYSRLFGQRGVRTHGAFAMTNGKMLHVMYAKKISESEGLFIGYEAEKSEGFLDAWSRTNKTTILYGCFRAVDGLNISSTIPVGTHIKIYAK